MSDREIRARSREGARGGESIEARRSATYEDGQEGDAGRCCCLRSSSVSASVCLCLPLPLPLAASRLSVSCAAPASMSRPSRL